MTEAVSVDLTNATLTVGAPGAYVAAGIGDSARLRQLIESDSGDLAEPWVNGANALHVAAQKGHLECVKLILAEGNPS
eukprot:SAG31_NODE_8409_length_1457_cov_1.311487_2_plen_78_part_00